MFVRALSLFLLLLLPIGVSAQETSRAEIPAENSPEEIRAVLNAMSFQLPIAKTFGCDKFAWGSAVNNHRSLKLEFVPASDEVQSWTRMMTVTVYVMPHDPAQYKEAMTDLMGKLLANYSGHGKIISQDMYHDGMGNPREYLEYEIGEGIQKEHAAGVFWSTGANSASFNQIQTRGIAFDDKDANNMKLFAEGKLPITKQ